MLRINSDTFILQCIHSICSWEWGGSSFFIYNGENIVQYANVIVVTSNYRLGPFGFLGSSQLAALTGDKSTGNYGLQDQRAAMVWIQDNIEAFGGDINRVMLFGESAGAGSTAAHLVSPRSKGLFQYAAMESGPPSGLPCCGALFRLSFYAQTFKFIRTRFKFTRVIDFL